MKVISLSLLLLSFASCPEFVLALDGSHSIALLNEHHLVFFHRADGSENGLEKYFAPQENDEHHEVHLSPSTGWIQKKLQIPSFPTNMSSTTDTVDSSKTLSTYSVNTFEPDVGSIQPPLLVLRI